MIYDKQIKVLRLPDGVGTISQAKQLVQVFSAYCGELEVYHRRYWEAVQAGSRVDCMVELPLHRKDAEAAMFAAYGSRLWEIVQAQFGEDEQGLPVTRLSLKRPDYPLMALEVIL